MKTKHWKDTKQDYYTFTSQHKGISKPLVFMHLTEDFSGGKHERRMPLITISLQMATQQMQIEYSVTVI